MHKPQRQWLTALALLFFAAIAAVAAYAAQPDGAVPLNTVTSTMKPPLRMAALELRPEQLEDADARDRIAKRLQTLRDQGARFVVLPGPVLPAGDLNVGAIGEPIPGDTTQWLGTLARQLGLWLIAPVFEARDVASGEQRNKADAWNAFLTVVLVNPKGEIEYKTRAVLPNPAFGRLPVARGNYRDTLRSVDVGGLRVGILAGNDAVPGIARLSDLGADVIFLSGDLLEPIGAARMRALAKENNVSIVVANRRASGGAAAFIASAQGDTIEAPTGGDALLDIRPIARAWTPSPKLGLPASVPHPNRVKATPELAELGRRLFIDPRFSATGTVACASCHNPMQSFSNGAPLGSGVYGRSTRRNVPSLVNVAYRPLLRWDGYASSLENFVKYPMSGVNEMDFHYLDQATVLVRRDPDYRAAFEKIFGAIDLSFDQVELALAAYLRTILSGNSAFDRYYYGGEQSALNEAQRRGLALFQGKAQCATCHQIGERDALFTDFDYHDVGVGWQSATHTYKDIGLGGISTAQFDGQFLTPSLRNVARTGPYMHDGSLASLRDVVDFFDRGGIAAPGRDARIVPLGLNEQEKDDLVAFLQSLNGDGEWDAEGRPLTKAQAASRAAPTEGGSR